MKRITIIGNAVATPEVRTTKSGVRVAEVRIAVTPRFKDKQTNEWKDGTTEWFSAVFWDRKVSKVSSIQKGMKVFVEGELSTRTYEKKDGTKGFALEITADQIFPLLMVRNAAQGEQQQAPAQDFASEEIPF